MHQVKEPQKSAHERFPQATPTHVTQISADLMTIDGRRYRIIRNDKDALRKDRLAERYEAILDKYDYIVGDWGYEQLRLKGFYNQDRKQAAPDQLISHLEDYLYEYCNFGCAYFVIERLDAPVIDDDARRKRPVRSRNQRRGKPSVARDIATDGDSKRPREGGNHRRGGRGRRGGRAKETTREGAKPFSEKKVHDRRPERGQKERASTAGKPNSRHFSVRKQNETNKEKR